MKIVLDTNVLVSGLLTPYGSSGKIVRMIFSGDLTLILDARILSEYRDVLVRPKFGFNKDDVASAYQYNIDLIPCSHLSVVRKQVLLPYKSFEGQ
jgi:hypothetical protein